MKSTSKLAGIPVGIGHPVRLMGVINLSPESFYKGSIQTNALHVARAAEQITEEGADFIDVGAMSTAPYLKTQISEEEETRRLRQAIKIIVKHTPLPISVDTTRSTPAQAALDHGARIINDVRGLQGDPRMAALVKQFKGLVLMANPQSTKATLTAPLKDTKTLFTQCVARALKAGRTKGSIVLDPGIGFFRNTKLPWWKWDLEILRNLSQLTTLGYPLLIGVSRKSFIGHLLNVPNPTDRLPGSLAATAIAVLKGASIIRTHDVKATKQAIQLAQTLR
jgi:dihydropteroate synthase